MSRTVPVQVRFSALGDSALLVGVVADDKAMSGEVLRLLRALERDRPDWITDLVAAYESIGVFYDVGKIAANHKDLPHSIVSKWVKDTAAKAIPAASNPIRETEILVCYGSELGPDLDTVAKHTGLKEDDVIRIHSNAGYLVRAMGFAPGFPYLGGLPPKLHTPRLDSPRTKVPAGSVGIGGAQTGVYPFDSPGGWNIIGRTPMRLFNPENSPPALLQIGDRVKFRGITEQEFKKLADAVKADDNKSRVRPGLTQEAALEVLSPGVQTLVQDRGRTGFQHQGVTPGGAMDPFALRMANLLVGNKPDAAVLEMALVGAELRFLKDTVVAITGAEVGGIAGWRPLHVDEGDVLDLRHLIRGAIVYLAIGGGIDVPVQLNGRGTDLRGGFGGHGGRALRKGDELCAGEPAQQIRQWLALDRAGELEDWFVGIHGRPAYSVSPTIRVLRGAQAGWFDAATWKEFLGKAFEVLPRSDRMGIRLSGPQLALKSAREMRSEAVASGSIQVPPSGQPIVLMADRQTIGGYPKIAQSATVDLPLLAQLRPGDSIRFREITIEEAEALLLEQVRQFEVLKESISNHFESQSH